MAEVLLLISSKPLKLIWKDADSLHVFEHFFFFQNVVYRVLRFSSIGKYFLDVPTCPEKGHFSYVIQSETEVLGFFPKLVWAIVTTGKIINSLHMTSSLRWYTQLYTYHRLMKQTNKHNKKKRMTPRTVPKQSLFVCLFVFPIKGWYPVFLVW